MLNILVTDSQTLYKKSIDKILSEKNVSSDMVSIYDFEFTGDVDDVKTELLSESIFNEKKMIIVKNFEEFGAKVMNTNTRKKLQYFIETEFDNELLLITSKINPQNDFLLKNKENIKVYVFQSPKKTEFVNYIMDWCKKRNVQITQEFANQITKFSNENFDIINSNLEKARLFNGEITFENFNKLFYDLRAENIFDVVNYFLAFDYVNLEKKIDLLYEDGIQPFLILQRVIDDLLLITEIRVVKQENPIFKIADIANQLNVNEYRANKLISSSAKWTNKKLLDTIKELLKTKIQILKSKTNDISIMIIKIAFLGMLQVK